MCHIQSGGSVKAEGLGDGAVQIQWSHRQAALDAATRRQLCREAIYVTITVRNTRPATGYGGWMENRIKPEQIEKYLDNGREFIDEAAIERALAANVNPDPKRVREILAKSLAIETLTPDETACLLHVEDPELLAEMRQTAAAVKTKVYDNRIVTFAPLYLSNLCVNDCVYCGFRCSNHAESRRILSQDEVRREVEVLAGQIGHKRLIVVYGEHPKSGIDYIAETLRTIMRREGQDPARLGPDPPLQRQRGPAAGSRSFAS